VPTPVAAPTAVAGKMPPPLTAVAAITGKVVPRAFVTKSIGATPNASAAALISFNQPVPSASDIILDISSLSSFD